MANTRILKVQSAPVTIIKKSDTDFIALTDMVRKSESGSAVIDNWLWNKNTLEFLSVRAQIYKPAFNYLEFEVIKIVAVLNRFTMSVKRWITRTDVIGLLAQAGLYGTKPRCFQSGLQRSRRRPYHARRVA